MCTSHEREQGEAAQAGAGRRRFLRATALMGAAATVATALPAGTAQAAAVESAASASAARWRPDADSRRCTPAVMPDTRYLFDGPSIDKAPVEASPRYLLERGREEDIVFPSHLGDLTRNGAQKPGTAKPRGSG